MVYNVQTETDLLAFVIRGARLLACCSLLAGCGSKPSSGVGAEAVREAQDLQDNGDIEAAIAQYTRAIDKNPKFVEAYRDRGRCFLTMQRFEEAVADFDQAIELDRQGWHAHFYRGQAHSQLGAHSKAIGDFSRAIKINPLDQRAFRHRSEAYRSLGNEPYAEDDLQKARELEKRFGIVSDDR